MISKSIFFSVSKYLDKLTILCGRIRKLGAYYEARREAKYKLKKEILFRICTHVLGNVDAGNF